MGDDDDIEEDEADVDDFFLITICVMYVCSRVINNSDRENAENQEESYPKKVSTPFSFGFSWCASTEIYITQ